MEKYFNLLYLKDIYNFIGPGKGCCRFHCCVLKTILISNWRKYNKAIGWVVNYVLFLFDELKLKFKKETDVRFNIN
jgi:hypothetical protein